MAKTAMKSKSTKAPSMHLEQSTEKSNSKSNSKSNGKSNSKSTVTPDEQPNEKPVEKLVEKVQDTIHSDNATHTGTFRNQPNKMVRQAEFTLQILQLVSENFSMAGMSSNAVFNQMLGCITSDSVDEVNNHIRLAKRKEKRQGKRFVGIDPVSKKPLRAKNANQFFRLENKDKLSRKHGFTGKELNALILSEWNRHREANDTVFEKYQEQHKKDKSRVELETVRQHKEAIDKGEIDPPKPKKPSTAYFLFANSPERREARTTFVGTQPEFAKATGEIWRKMTEKKKEKYEKEHTKIDVAYRKELAAWTADCAARNAKKSGINLQDDDRSDAEDAQSENEDAQSENENENENEDAQSEDENEAGSGEDVSGDEDED